MTMKPNDLTIDPLLHADEWPKDVPIHFISNESPPTLIPARIWVARAYLRRLRAAEMAAWELTGGDYLLSQCVTRTGSM